MSKPRDPTEAHAERIDWLREQHMGVVCSVLRRLAVYAPGSLIKQAEAEIRESANTLAWDASKQGGHYVHQRTTNIHTPPDPDKAPRRRADWDDEPTPVVSAQERARRGR